MVSGELLSPTDTTAQVFSSSFLRDIDLLHSSELEAYRVHKIKNHQRPVMGKRGNPSDIVYGYMCTTDNGDWFVVPPKDLDQLKQRQNVPELNGAGEALRERQRSDGVQTNLPHHENLLFSIANAALMQRMLFYRQHPQPAVPEQVELFTEVDFNDLAINPIPGEIPRTCGRADIIQVGPDGQLIIFEVSSESYGKKAAQVARHALGLQAVLEQKNHGKIPPVETFVGRYKKEHGATTLTIRRGLTAASPYKDAIVQPLKRDPKMIDIFDARTLNPGFTFST